MTMEKPKLHPLEKARELGESYVYWHMREIHEETITEASERGTSIEIDIAYDEDNDSIYVGHPKEFYTIEKKIPLPNNIDIDRAVEMLKEVDDVIVVLDCKHRKALPKIKGIIGILGAHRCILHSFIKEWGEPYPEGTHIEAHWPAEDVPFDDIKAFIDDTGVKCIGAMHALSVERVKEESLLDRALSMAKGFESVSIYLPGVEVPPEEFSRQTYKAGYLPWISQDEVVAHGHKFDFPYVGMADDPNLATVTKEFLAK